MSLSNDQKTLANQAVEQRNKTTSYLSGIEDPLAQGKGGYNADELAGIRLTPQQQQDMVTGAGISAGVGTAAATDAATRAANAVGGNPAALATYRERAARSGAGAAGDAATQARINASNTAAQREESIGGVRLGQQDKALDYYSGLEGQQNQNAENAYGRQVQTAQMPSMFDKVLGAAGGALSAIPKLEDGSNGDTEDAVIGEDGPERVVNKMGMGGSVDPVTGDPVSGAPVPPAAPVAPGTGALPWMKNLGKRLGQMRPPAATPPQQQQQPWSPVDSYRTLGQGAGMAAGALARRHMGDGSTGSDGTGNEEQQPWWSNLATYLGKSAAHSILPSSTMLADGQAPQGANGVFTEPTEVKLNPKQDAVVPLTYRPNARARPSMAMMPPARERPQYGA